jgi:hypothetical protein
MTDTEKEKLRTQKFLKIITHLNEHHRQGENNIFDCGKLGFVRIWWHSQWQHEWLMPSTEYKMY